MQTVPADLICNPEQGMSAAGPAPDAVAGRTLQATVPEHLVGMISSRLDKPIPCGNEGSGIVVAAGKSPEAQALLGKCVGVVGGAMYQQVKATTR